MSLRAVNLVLQIFTLMSVSFSIYVQLNILGTWALGICRPADLARPALGFCHFRIRSVCDAINNNSVSRGSLLLKRFVDTHYARRLVRRPSCHT